QQLQAQLRRRVDEDVALRGADEDGAAVALVARVGRTTNGAVATDHRHAHRRAGAEEGEGPSGHAVSVPWVSDGPCRLYGSFTFRETQANSGLNHPLYGSANSPVPAPSAVPAATPTPSPRRRPSRRSSPCAEAPALQPAACRARAAR